MGAPRSTTVDVRDMLCAQALALVAQAVERLQAGETLEVLSNADDVKQDLMAWATDQGHIFVEVKTGSLSIGRRPASIG